MSHQSKKPTLILLPGIFGTGLMFTPLIEALPEFQCQVIAYPTDRVLHYTELANYVQAQLPQHEPFYILAESFAGPLALLLSERLGEQLQALILVCSFIKNPRPVLSLFAPLLLRDRFLAKPPTRFMAKLIITGFSVTKEMLDLAFAIQRRVAVEVFRNRLHDAMHVDVSAQLKNATVPILHLYGTRDRIIPRSAGRKIRKVRPDIASIAILGPHYLLQTRAQSCVEQIKKFLQAI